MMNPIDRLRALDVVFDPSASDEDRRKALDDVSPDPEVRDEIATLAKTPTIVPPAGPELVPGYEILEGIGRGGMGVVYRARQKVLRREVALKVPAESPVDPRTVDRFKRAADVQSKLQDDRIVKVYAAGAHAGQPFLAMELLPGRTLADWQPAEVNPGAGARVVKDLAEAVAHCHDRDIVHRDLKPTNVLLDWRAGDPPGVKIADFGLAVTVRGSTVTVPAGQGTPGYMAPEQIDGAAVGRPADVYALGAFLYMLLTRREPPPAEEGFPRPRDRTIGLSPRTSTPFARHA
jgi:serine/threonine-protein kinase